MEKDFFYSDMALDNLERGGFESLAIHKKLSYGIEQIVVNLKDKVLSDKVGKPQGVYVTYDVSGVTDDRYADYLVRILSSTITQLVGGLARGSIVLSVGLGNGEVLADSLGEMTMRKLRPTRVEYLTDTKFKLCSHSLGVQGATGLKSHEVLSALNDKVKPSAIIIVDTLATSNVGRIGTSFQLSTAGIIPGSGVGGDKPRMDKSVFGVPTLSIGVPLVMNMQGVLKDFVSDFFEDKIDQFKFSSTLAEKGLSRLVVAPKEVKIFLENASNIIAGALNLAYSK
ncbi:MAG: GPR endopeptidase [Clostridia bacterium]|nr:GPR endopeptidase [Clostridia bacterium]